MPLLLTILSVLALWALLATLIVGLLLILKPLESVRSHMQRIAMGVRAIERETKPLGESAVMLTDTLVQAANAFDGVARQMADVQRDLEKVSF
jgi:uncharacterized protein YoxC